MSVVEADMHVQRPRLQIGEQTMTPTRRRVTACMRSGGAY